MTDRQRFCLSVLVVWTILVLAAEVGLLVRRHLQENAPENAIRKVIATDLSKNVARQTPTRHGKLPLGKEKGLAAGLAELKQQQKLFGTPEAMFGVVKGNYLVELFVDTQLKVEITERGSSWSSPRFDHPLPFPAETARPQQRLKLKGDYMFVIRMFMLRYLPVPGQFKFNLGYRKLSDDPTYEIPVDATLTFTPEQATWLEESDGAVTEAENGVILRLASGSAQKLKQAGTFVYRAFIYPDARMRRVARGGRIASKPLVVRVGP